MRQWFHSASPFFEFLPGFLQAFFVSPAVDPKSIDLVSGHPVLIDPYFYE